MPRRWLDPAFFTDEKLAMATLEERHLFAAMIANQDDDGRLLGHPGYLRSIAFPYDDFANEEVKRMRDHLAEVNPNVIVYENSGHEYIQLRRHYRYQRPRYYHPSKFPAPIGWPFKDESRSNPPSTSTDSNHKVTAQQSTEQPHSNHEVTARYTEGRVGKGGVGSDLDLDKGNRLLRTEVPAATEAATLALSESKEAGSKTKSQRRKPRQVETAIFLDLVEKYIGTKLVQRPKLMGLIRPLLTKFPEITPENLLECFKWLKENDPYCRARDSPAVISFLPSKYPEWAAGKLRGKEEQHGDRGKGRRGKVHTREDFSSGNW